VHNRNDRAAGFMLNDAQIASIKTRLHLTADQEQMWPAVEAALRNIAYTRSRDARRRSAPANTQIASADAVDVRDLKSAAIPLIMSFNSEQKDEVRNLAHVMGLDQLATQF
jgi:zinc resistance-associated protein